MRSLIADTIGDHYCILKYSKLAHVDRACLYDKIKYQNLPVMALLQCINIQTGLFPDR